MSFDTVPDIREYIASGNVKNEVVKEEKPAAETNSTGFVIHSDEFDSDNEENDQEDN